MVRLFTRILGAPYRAFFLVAGLYALFTLGVWMLWLGGPALGIAVPAMAFAPPPHLWHGHELIFGYAAASVGGFLLTAVPNWTGGKGAPQIYVGLAVALWLAGRLAVWFSGALPASVVALADLSFLPLLGIQIAAMLIKRPKPQNVLFLLFLCLLWAGNLLVHLEWMGWAEDTLATGLRLGLLALCLMIAVLGGRVTPAFTRNAMKRVGVPESRWPRSRRPADLGAIVLTGLATLALAIGLPEPVIGVLALAGGAVQLLRIAFWRPLWTLGQPILWALHLGMAMLGAGLILWGLANLGLGSEVAALHVLGIGAVGGTTLAVMSRAILGHTGRELVAPAPVALAFGLIALAALLRWGAAEFATALYLPAMLVSGALWLLAFALYTAALWPAFTGARLPAPAG